jgi:hypothetical protein
MEFGIFDRNYIAKSILWALWMNSDKLPGPPQNIKVEILSDTEAKVSWDVPVINPHAASVYR